MSIAKASRLGNTPPMMRRAGDIQVARAPDTALVTLAPAVETRPTTVNRPDASFVAHLIATATQAPQTRILRRADGADVEAAYKSVANQNGMAGAGRRMRLTA
jgi:hypothetical protein